MQILTVNDFKEQPWKNGGGRTLELLRIPHPNDPSTFILRISKAFVEQDGPFSVFPNIQRELFLLKGNGMILHLENGEKKELKHSLDEYKFRGDEKINCKLISGSNEDYNIMYDENYFKTHTTTHFIDAKQGLKIDLVNPTYVFLYNKNQLISLNKSFEFFFEQKEIAIITEVSLVKP